MAQGAMKYLKQTWRNLDENIIRERMTEWRASEAITKLEKPSRLDRARALGYKAKKGIIILRVRVKRGGKKRTRVGVKGRKSKKQTNRKMLKMNYQWRAEIRAERKYPSLEVLNSYYVGKDGKYFYFEVIMVDPSKNEIKNDRTLSWITNPKNQKRAQRGLTSSAKKSRGLRSKSHNLKVRPSLRSWNRKGK